MPSRQEIIAKAADDGEFRDKLTSDPKGTLEEELGTTLPDDVTITVLEETADQVYLVLPAVRSKQLTSSELAGVAGGASLADTFEAQLAANREAQLAAMGADVVSASNSNMEARAYNIKS